jgi:hypothetical protein
VERKSNTSVAEKLPGARPLVSLPFSITRICEFQNRAHTFPFIS